MRGRLLRTFVAAGVVIFSHGVHAVEFPDMVRDLNGMQNRMVMGDEKARENVARQFDLIERTIMTLEPETWTEEKKCTAPRQSICCVAERQQICEKYSTPNSFPTSCRHCWKRLCVTRKGRTKPPPN